MIRPHQWFLVAAVPWLAGGPIVATARADDVQVNTYTTGSQRSPSVAMGPDGGFVVVWTSEGGGSGALAYGVQAQRYAANGTPLGGQFRVNTYTSSGGYSPRVAVAPDGDFVVVWYSYYSPGNDPRDSIQARLYTSDGSPVGDQFQVNTNTPGEQYGAAVASNADGDFVVVWGTYLYDYYAPVFSVHGRRFASDGIPKGGEFQANTYTTSTQARPAVAFGSGGDFVVVWHSYGSAGTDTSGSSIQFRRYDAGGFPVGAEFQVNTQTPGRQSLPRVVSDAAGDFIVVWQSGSSGGSDASFMSIQGRRYASDGAPVDDQFQVNTYTPGYQRRPTVAADADGNFVVAWQSDGSNGTDASDTSIQAQAFTDDGSPLGGEVQVNTYVTSYQRFPSVALGPAGASVIAWYSDGSSGTDASGTSIQKTPSELIFADGFESGDTSAW